MLLTERAEKYGYGRGDDSEIGGMMGDHFKDSGNIATLARCIHISQKHILKKGLAHVNIYKRKTEYAVQGGSEQHCRHTWVLASAVQNVARSMVES